MITLTPTGKQAAENTRGRGPQFAILSHLYESGGSVEVEEAIDATNMDFDKGRSVIKHLISKGLITQA